MSTYCFAQLECEWVYDITHEGNEYIKLIAVDQDGNIYALVDFSNGNLVIGNDTMVPPPSGLRPIFLMKLSNDGVLIWANQITTSDRVVCLDVCTDNENNVYVGGLYKGDIDISGTLVSSSSSSMFIAKYDGEGNVLDVFNYPDIGSASISSMCLNSSNEIFIVGHYLGDCTIGDFDLIYNTVNPGRTDIYVAKIDIDGNIIWVNCISGEGTNTPMDISCDGNSNIYLLAKFSSAELLIGNFTLFSSVLDLTKYDILIVRYNSEGDVIWAEKLGDEKDDAGNSISVDFENNILVAGKFSGNNFVFNDTVLEGGGSCLNSFLVKFDSTYNTIWGMSFDYQGNNEAKCVTTDLYGNSYLLGSFANYINLEGFNIISAGATDIYVAQLNSEGIISDLYWAGGDSFDNPTEIVIDPYGNCIIAGFFSSSILEFGNNTVYSDYVDYTDSFVAKLYSTTNIAKNEINLSIFPNPTSNTFAINIENNPAEVQIFNLHGKLIKLISNYTGEQIDVSDICKGLYFVKLFTDNEISDCKLVIE